MVVHNLDVQCARQRPAKTDPELVVDADAVLPCTISPQRLQPIARWYSQIVEAICN